MAVAAPPPQLQSRVSPKSIARAVNALLKWQRDSNSKTQMPQLLNHDESDDFLYLIVTLKKIPQKDRTRPENIPLPNPLIPFDSSPELCLIIDDRPKKVHLTKDAAMKKIKQENIPIANVIKLSKLRTDYRAFEEKRKLCDSYDMFFAERKVIHLLPKLLGKQFFKKKKIPVAVDLKSKNWKEEVERVCGSALFYWSTGTCSVVKVAKVSMGREEIVENVMAAIDGIADVVPSKWKNIRSFHLKLLESLALPVYQSVPDLKLKSEALSNGKDGTEHNCVDNDENGDKDENSSRKTKRRIPEVRHMDSNVYEMLDDDEIGADGGKHSENDEMGVDEFEDKERKKGGEVAKSAKKAAKVVKKEDKEKTKDVVRQKRDWGEPFRVKDKKKKRSSM